MPSSSSSSSSWPAFPGPGPGVRRTANMLVRSPDSLPRLAAPRDPSAPSPPDSLDSLDSLDPKDRRDRREPSRLPPTRRRRAVTAPQPNASRGKRPLAAALLAALAALGLLAALFLLWQRRAEAPAPPLTAERVLAGVTQRYRRVAHLAADLRLTSTNFSFNATSKRDGRLTLGRGGKLRWDTFEAAPAGAASDAPRRPLRSLVSDGEALTLVDFAQRELVKLHRPDDQLVFATSALFSSTLAADFTAQLASLEGYLDDDRGLLLEQDPDRPRYALALLPRAANPRAQRLILLVDAQMNVRQLVLENPYGRTRMVLGEQDERTPPPPGCFAVDPSSPALAGFRFVDAEL